MEVLRNAEFPGQFRDGMQRIHRVILPARASSENLSLQTDPHVPCLRFDERNVLSSDVDRFMENGDGVEFGHGAERCAQVGLTQLTSS